MHWITTQIGETLASLGSYKDAASTIQTLLTCVGIVFAGGFLIYKVWTGWLYVNMAVEIKTERLHAKEEDKDHLAVSVHLEKGGFDSVSLKAIEVRLTRLDAEAPPLDLSITSFKPVAEADGQKKKVVWEADLDPKREKNGIALAPNEKVEHGCYTQIARDGIYRVDVAVFGTRPFFKWWTGHLIQWRSSAISLPKEETAKR